MRTAQLPHRRHALVAFSLLAATALIPAAYTQAAGATLVITHKVESFEKWKPVYDSTNAWKPSFGWKQGRVFIADGDRNSVMVIEDFDTLEHAKTFASSVNLHAAMSNAGVIGAPNIRFFDSDSIPTARAPTSDGTIVVVHRVESYTTWKPFYDSTAPWKLPFGWRRGTVLTAIGDRNNVMLIEDFDTLDDAKKFASSPDFKAAMGNAGVVYTPDIRVVDLEEVSRL